MTMSLSMFLLMLFVKTEQLCSMNGQQLSMRVKRSGFESLPPLLPNSRKSDTGKF